MKLKPLLVLFALLPFYSFVNAQEVNIEWFSTSEQNGIVVQNSFPKGGPYTAPTSNHFNHSYLVFFSRVINQTEKPFELKLHFSADSFPIPNSPNTFVKLFLPSRTMTLAKRHLFSYGVTELASFDQATLFQKTVQPNEDCLFYVVAFFYQTKTEAKNQPRGGNRAELVVKENQLFYNLSPQVKLLPCGQLIFN